MWTDHVNRGESITRSMAEQMASIIFSDMIDLVKFFLPPVVALYADCVNRMINREVLIMGVSLLALAQQSNGSGHSFAIIAKCIAVDNILQRT